MQLEAGLALTNSGFFHATTPERAHRRVTVTALVSRTWGAFAMRRWEAGRCCGVGTRLRRRFCRRLNWGLCNRLGCRRLGCCGRGRMVTGAKNSDEHHGAGERTDFHGKRA